MSSERFLPETLDLELPVDWVEFPTTAEAISQYEESLLESADASEMGPFDRRAVRSAFQFIKEAMRDSSVNFAAGFVGAEPATPDPILVMCSVVASTLTRAEVGTDLPLLSPVLLQAYSIDDADVPVENLEPPSLMTLEVGEVVRTVRLVGRPGNQERPQVLVQTYLIPVAEGDGVVVVQFSTINIDQSRAFSQLFDLVASTIRIRDLEDLEAPSAAARDDG